MFDLQISVADAVKIFVLAGGMLTTIITLRVTVKDMKEKFGEIKLDFEKITAKIEGLQDLKTRMGRAEQDIRDLQRGIGYRQGHDGIDGEYVK